LGDNVDLFDERQLLAADRACVETIMKRRHDVLLELFG
jgi:hypothetical protein